MEEIMYYIKLHHHHDICCGICFLRCLRARVLRRMSHPHVASRWMTQNCSPSPTYTFIFRDYFVLHHKNTISFSMVTDLLTHEMKSVFEGFVVPKFLCSFLGGSTKFHLNLTDVHTWIMRCNVFNSTLIQEIFNSWSNIININCYSVTKVDRESFFQSIINPCYYSDHRSYIFLFHIILHKK